MSRALFSQLRRYSTLILPQKHQPFLSCCSSRLTRKFATLNLDDDGDPVPEGMKTKVTVLSQDEDAWLSITAFSEIGFLLNNGVRVMGPCVMFPRSVLHWNIAGVEDIKPDALSIFPLLVPRLDIVVLGVGEMGNLAKVDPLIIPFLRSNKINIEILATEHALTTYNFLSSEKRYVAGAFLPPNFISQNIAESSIHYSTGDDHPYVTGGAGPTSLTDMNVPQKEVVLEYKIPNVLQEERKRFKHKLSTQKNQVDEPETGSDLTEEEQKLRQEFRDMNSVSGKSGDESKKS